MRPRWVRRSARISTCRSTAARRPIGATATGSPAIRNCRKASCRWPNVVQAPAALARRLAQIGIVEPADAGRLAGTLAPGQRLVSRDGALWRWDGMVAGADAPTAAAQRLAQKNRLAELDAEAVAATKILRAAEQALADAERRSREGAEAERLARQGWRDAQHRLDAARDALDKAEKASGELSMRRAALAELLSRLGEAHSEAAAAVAEAERGLAAAPDLAGLQQAFDRLAAEVQRDRAALADARARHDGLKREAEQRTRRLAAIATDRVNWIARGDNAGRQIVSLNERRNDAGTERAGLEDAPDEIEMRRRGLMSQLSEAESLRKAAADRLQQAENQQAAARQGRRRGNPGAFRGARDAGSFGRAADRLRRTAPRGRGPHPGGAQHAAASGDPPDRAAARRARCRRSPMSSGGSNG